MLCPSWHELHAWATRLPPFNHCERMMRSRPITGFIPSVEVAAAVPFNASDHAVLPGNIALEVSNHGNAPTIAGYLHDLQ